MRRVIRRALGAGVVVTLLAVGMAMAAAPAGPRLAVIEVTTKSPGLELATVDPSGGGAVHLAGGGRRARPQVDFFSPLSWSPDGETIAFSGITGVRNGDDHEPIEKIFIARANGSGLRAIAKTNGATGPVFAPDGRTVAFTRTVERETRTTVGGKSWPQGFTGSSIWTIDLETGGQRQLTPWQPGLRYSASSYAPDGSTLLATYEDPRFVYEPQPVALNLAGGGMRRLFNDGSSPVYSPDGSRIAFVRRVEEYGKEYGESSDLYVINADGTGPRRLTRTPGRSELSPSWDPSGERLAYVRLPLARSEDAPFGFSDTLMQVNADGTCQTKLRSAGRGFFFVPSWQPGPDRGAGRIECQ